MVFTATGNVRELELTEAAVQRCLGRMRCWCRLAHEILRAEFPDFSLLNAFGALHLEGRANMRGANRLVGASPPRNPDLERLAQAFSVDADELSAELDRLAPVAANIQRQLKCNNREAWFQAWQKTQTRAPTRNSYPANALGQVLPRCPAGGEANSVC